MYTIVIVYLISLLLMIVNIMNYSTIGRFNLYDAPNLI